MKVSVGGITRLRPRGGGPGAAAVLAVWTGLLVVGRIATGEGFGSSWLVFVVGTCVCGFLVALGRYRVSRSDTWEAAVIAVPVSLLGPLGLVFLLLSPVRRALREVPLQLRGDRQALVRLEQARAAASHPPAPRPTAPPLPHKSFFFGDLRRPRKLAVVVVASVALFPVLAFVFVVLYGLGATTSGSREAARVIVVLAAIPAATGVLLAGVDSLRARRSYPRAHYSRLEAVVCGLALVLVLGAGVALGIWLWNAEL